MDVNADIPISSSNAYAPDQNPFQDASTVFEFSSPGNSVGGHTYNPSDDASATATSAAGNSAGLFSTSTLVILGLIVLGGIYLWKRHA